MSVKENGEERVSFRGEASRSFLPLSCGEKVLHNFLLVRVINICNADLLVQHFQRRTAYRAMNESAKLLTQLRDARYGWRN